MWNGKLRRDVENLVEKVKDLEKDQIAREELVQIVEDLSRKIDNFELDYHNLYEKVRTNLAKLRNRAESASEEAPPADPLAEARKALLARKLKGIG